ncbi:MAG: hypothetical protein OEY99_08095 [Aigarchaeota archaeon]|nr:hypothetical protein [Aigarchaeota archaeon]
MRLFYDIFGRYGRVAKTPSYDKTTSQYQWSIHALLNSSFDFFLGYKKNPKKFLSVIAKVGKEYDYVGGFADAESCVGVYDNNGYPRTHIQIGNNNRKLLEWMQGIIGGSVHRNGDCYLLQMWGREAIEALRKIPVTHAEKVAAKQLILGYADNGRVGLEALGAYRALRRKIDAEVLRSISEAQLEWIRRHGRPHPRDPDQTISSN